MGNDLAGKKVAFLGAGKMGGIILQALLKSGMLSPKSTYATVAHEERAKALATKLKVKVGLSHYTEADMLAKLSAAGYRAERAKRNIGHNQRRMTFLARPA